CERQHRSVVDARLGELRESGSTIEETNRHAIRCAELRGVWRRRSMLHRKRFPEAVDGAFSNLARDGLDVAGGDALFRELDGAIDKRLRHGAAGVRLER